jgi:type IV pilus assembly protein PilC
MPKFAYKVMDSAGRNDSGVLVAEDLDSASRLLRSDGKFIVGLKEELAAIGNRASSLSASSRGIKKDDVIFFCTQLAVMVDTGVPLAEAVELIAANARPGLKEVANDICDQVKAGVEFSAALEKHPKLFGTLFVALMKASEASGTMPQMLQRACEYMQQERETVKRVKGAMVYPICMLAFCLMVVVSLLAFVLPRFESIYAGKGATLPLPTRILLGLSNGLVHYWYAVIGIVVGVAFVGVTYFRSPSGKILADRIRLGTPVIGGIYRKACLARSLRTLATMVNTGVSLLEGLTITARVSGNHFYRQIWDRVAREVKEGSNISEHLFKAKLIPPSVAQMISAGEKSGKLGVVMDRIAQFCEDDMKTSIKTMTGLIEPAMIIIMGALVGGIAISLLLPIFSIAKVVAH